MTTVLMMVIMIMINMLRQSLEHVVGASFRLTDDKSHKTKK